MLKKVIKTGCFRSYRAGLYYKAPEEKNPKVVRIDDHPTFGYKNVTVSLEHLEYLKRKSELEIDDTERWELFDWSIDKEINSFSKRLGVSIEGDSMSYEIIRMNYETGKDSKIIKETLQKYLSSKMNNYPIAISEVCEYLSSSDKIVNVAKSLGFHNLLQQKNCSDESIANIFLTFLDNLAENSENGTEEIILKLFTPEIITSHNIVNLWPRAWDQPTECLEEILGNTIECRLVKAVGINSTLPTYVIAVFDNEKNFIGKSIGESPYLASLDACRVALQNILNYRH